MQSDIRVMHHAKQCCKPALQKELREIERDKTSGVTVQLKGNSLQRLTGFVEGALALPRSDPLYPCCIIGYILSRLSPCLLTCMSFSFSMRGFSAALTIAHSPGMLHARRSEGHGIRWRPLCGGHHSW